ncbi:hypothetical protein WI25_28095 [Burkholderia cepacia]|nr:hypothetical protein WI25_28095 [Burkholderia cepacia]
MGSDDDDLPLGSVEWITGRLADLSIKECLQLRVKRHFRFVKQQNAYFIIIQGRENADQMQQSRCLPSR